MKGHCACVATGMSSHAIARAFGHCASGGFDHPRDPADLRRCVDYCTETGITAEALRDRMINVSDSWHALSDAWVELTTLLAEEVADGTGRAPRTYRRMSEVLGRRHP